HVLRDCNASSFPERRQNMMCLVDDNPMGMTCACPQFLNTRKKAFKECGSFFQSNSDKIHHRVFSRLCQHVENFGNAGRPLLVAKRDSGFEGGVVALRIDYDELIVLFVETLHEARSERRFPGAGTSGD